MNQRKYDRHLKRAVRFALKANREMLLAREMLVKEEDATLVDFVADIEHFVALNEEWQDEQ